MSKFSKKQSISISIVISQLFFNDIVFAGTLTDLGTLGGTDSNVIAISNTISSDGSTVVGNSFIANGDTHAFKYTNSMIDIGTLGGNSSSAVAVSSDGSVIVGSSLTGAGETHAFKYTNNMVDIGTLPGDNYSAATDISSDGLVIVGTSSLFGAGHAFKYAGSTMIDLDPLRSVSNESAASAVSADGSVIVGTLTTGANETHAFKYTTATGMLDLGIPVINSSNYDNYSASTDVSNDGSVTIGQLRTIAGDSRAFKYAGTTMTDLGTLGGNTTWAYGLSSDGSVIVGYSETSSSEIHGFKYIGSSMTDLGTLGGTYSAASAVSGDGLVIVGSSTIASGKTRAFKYSGNTMTDLGTLGGDNSFAYAVSADGSVIVGNSEITPGSITLHAFIYRNNSSGALVDIQNTFIALSGNMRQQSAVLNLQNSLLNIGLNHDCTNFGQNNLCVALGGAYTSLNNPHAAQSNANLRVAYQVTPNIRIGAFADQSIHNSTPNNYDLKNDMPLVGAFAAWSQSPNDLGVGIKASLAYHQRDVNITRSVLAYTEAGRGDSQFTTKGAQVEGTYGFALNDIWLAQPFAGVRVSNVSRDAYRETTGAEFPIAYDHASQNATTAYVGARVAGKITEKAVLRIAGGG